MRSAGSLRARAERTVHIPAQSTGKRARLQLDGDAVGMDAALLGSAEAHREVVASLSETERLGLDALTMRRTKAWGRVKANRPRAGEPWDMVSCDGLRPRLDDGKLRDLLPDVMPGAQEEGEAAILRDLPGPAEGEILGQALVG